MWKSPTKPWVRLGRLNVGRRGLLKHLMGPLGPFLISLIWGLPMVAPNHPNDYIDHLSIETYGDLGCPHFKKTHLGLQDSDTPWQSNMAGFTAMQACLMTPEGMPKILVTRGP